MKKLIVILLTLAMGAALAACGGKKDDKGGDVPETQQAEQITPVETPTEKQAEDFELAEKTDANHFVALQGNAYHVVEHEGDTITGYYSYIKYDDASQAQITYAVFQEEYEAEPEEWQGVEKAEVVGNCFIIHYSSEIYEGMTFEAIEAQLGDSRVD